MLIGLLSLKVIACLPAYLFKVHQYMLAYKRERLQLSTFAELTNPLLVILWKLEYEAQILQALIQSN